MRHTCFFQGVRVAIVSAWRRGLEGGGTRYRYEKEDAGGGIGHQPPLRGDLVDQPCSEFCCTKGRTVHQLPPFLGLLVNYGTVIPNASEESYSRELGKLGTNLQETVLLHAWADSR